MSTLQQDRIWIDMEEDDRIAYEAWISQREADMLAQESYWDEVLYGQVDRQVREEYFNANPLAPMDCPDIPYVER
jgi:hypothetical protein